MSFGTISKLHNVNAWLTGSPKLVYQDSWAQRRIASPRIQTAAASSSGSEVAEEFEEGQLERPKWTGETPLSRLVAAFISFKPLYSVLKYGARQVIISTAEKSNISWRDMTQEILESDVYKKKDVIEDPSVVYPDYYLNPFHAYDEGNLSWLGLDLSPYFVAVAQYKDKLRNQGKNSIRWIHGNGESTGLPSQSFDLVSISYVFHECPERAIRNMIKEAFRLLRPGGSFALTDNSPKSKILQELPPVLFTLMKSTEPFLDEYYLTNVDAVLKQVGFVNAHSVLTDPRHVTVTATVPYHDDF